MDFSKCPCCKKTSIQPVNLRCEHHPCYSCCLPLVSLQPQSKLETKYKLVCPACKKKTVFYDLRHLIISETIADEEDLFVTGRYVEKKPSANEKPPSKRNSIQSIVAGTVGNPLNSNPGSCLNSPSAANQTSIKCPIHSQPYKYFCYDCHSAHASMSQNHHHHSHNSNALLCSSCHASHQPLKHKLLSLRQSIAHLANANASNRNHLPSQRADLICLSQMLHQKKTSLGQQYQKKEEQVNEQVKRVYQLIGQKYQQIRDSLRMKYEMAVKEISHLIDQVTSQKNMINILQSQSLSTLDSHIQFYNSYPSFQHSLHSMSIPAIAIPPLQIRSDLMKSSLQQWIFIDSSDLMLTNRGKANGSKRSSRKGSLVQDYSWKDKENKASTIEVKRLVL